jgi:hypothetical protein
MRGGTNCLRTAEWLIGGEGGVEPVLAFSIAVPKEEVAQARAGLGPQVRATVALPPTRQRGCSAPGDNPSLRPRSVPPMELRARVWRPM